MEKMICIFLILTSHYETNLENEARLSSIKSKKLERKTSSILSDVGIFTNIFFDSQKKTPRNPVKLKSLNPF